jgi:hypothetical protein
MSDQWPVCLSGDHLQEDQVSRIRIVGWLMDLQRGSLIDFFDCALDLMIRGGFKSPKLCWEFD